MKGNPFLYLAIALLLSTGCARLRSPAEALDPAAGSHQASSALADEELARLQGTWRIESSIWNGVPQPDPELPITILFEGNKFVLVDRDGQRMEETIRLMPEQDPKAIDCSSKGSSQAAPGIYILDGDCFQWCSAGGNNKVRPTSFGSTPGSKQSLMVLRRQRT
jgi:uncharacterized protein (TIGR03067 family)